MVCQYGLKETDTVEKCPKIVERALCPQFSLGKMQEYFLVPSSEVASEGVDVPEVWAQSHRD